MIINLNLFFVILFFFYWYMDLYFCDFKVIFILIIIMCKKYERMIGMNIIIFFNLFICIFLVILMIVIEIYSGEWGVEK